MEAFEAGERVFGIGAWTDYFVGAFEGRDEDLQDL